MGLNDWAKRKNRELHRKALEDRDTRTWHSAAYHRHFEGYTERQVTGPGGRVSIERIYTGSWYRQDVTRARYIGTRLLYALLFALMAGAVVLAARAQGSAGTAVYVVLPEVATLCLLAALLYTLLINYLFLPRKMTVGDYRASSAPLRRLAYALLAAYLLDALATCADAWLAGAAERFLSLPLTLAAFLAGAAMAACMAAVERRIPYVEEENPDSPRAEEGVIIEGDEQSPPRA